MVIFRHAAGLVLACLLLVGSVSAVPQERVVRLGVLFAGTYASSKKYFDAFFGQLASLGYVESRNLRVERRFADGRIDRLDALAAELVAAKMDVIFAPPTPAVLALKKATADIPIVFCLAPDPIGTGLVANLARPGGNVTGVSTYGSDLVAKRIDLLREIVPSARRIGVLYDSREPSAKSNRHAARESAKNAHLDIVEAEAHSRDGIREAFALLLKERTDALLVFEGSLGLSNRDLVLSLAAENKLPALYAYPEIVLEGGLMAYTANTVQQYRRAAVYVDKILKGAKASELPVEQPSEFQLVINRKTANSLRLRITNSMLLRADQVIN